MEKHLKFIAGLRDRKGLNRTSTIDGPAEDSKRSWDKRVQSGSGLTTWKWLQNQCLGVKASGTAWVCSRAAVCGLIYMRWSIFKILKQFKKNIHGNFGLSHK